ncbi:MAG TPA: NfeD family protein [Candidatus Binatia bacterium]|jgi:membrane protein implicated in regulation of membrane protease activity
MAALVLLLVRHYQMISFSGAVICFVAWVVKDWILYPWLRSAYEISNRTGSKTLIGHKGVAESHLAPEGLIRVRGELWRAVAIPRDLTIQTGIVVEIIDADGMTVFVRPLRDRAANDST